MQGEEAVGVTDGEVGGGEPAEGCAGGVRRFEGVGWFRVHDYVGY